MEATMDFTATVTATPKDSRNKTTTQDYYRSGKRCWWC